MSNDTMFALADELKKLRDTKTALEDDLKALNAKIDETDYRLTELMAETETQNFTRAGVMFCLTTKTRASAVAGAKDALFAALRKNGYGDLVYETVNANSLSSFVKEQLEERTEECGESIGTLPEWLSGLVNVFERTTVSVRKATR